MERINKTLQRLSGNENFQKRYQAMKQEILKNDEVRVFLHEHKDELTSGMIEKNLMKLYEYGNQSKECNKCASLGSKLDEGLSPRINHFKRGH